MKLRIINDDGYGCHPRKDWDNMGTILYKHSRYNLGEVEMTNPAITLCELAFPNEWADEKLDRLCDYHKWAWPDEREAIDYLLNYLETKRGFIILPLYIYDHSGITISTGSFGCRWDSGQFGWIYADLEAVQAMGHKWKRWTKERKDLVRTWLEGEVEVFDQYLTGDVWGFILEDEEGEEVDSCWGFFGDDPETNGMKDHISNEDWEGIEIGELEFNSY